MATVRPFTATKGESLSHPNKDEIKGRVKEAAGALTNDEELKREGKEDQLAGSLKQKAENVVDQVRDKVREKLGRDEESAQR